MSNSGIKLIVVCLLVFFPVGLAHAQNRDILQLDADVISLSQQVKLLQSSVDQNNAPQNDKSLSALYKKGDAQAAQSELQQAIDTFNQVVKTYPNTVEATNARLRIREIQALERHPLTQARSDQKIH